MARSKHFDTVIERVDSFVCHHRRSLVATSPLARDAHLRPPCQLYLGILKSHSELWKENVLNDESAPPRKFPAYTALSLGGLRPSACLPRPAARKPLQTATQRLAITNKGIRSANIQSSRRRPSFACENAPRRHSTKFCRWTRQRATRT